MILERLKKLEEKLKPFVKKSLKVITINPGDNKEEILKPYNRKDILLIEYEEDRNESNRTNKKT